MDAEPAVPAYVLVIGAIWLLGMTWYTFAKIRSSRAHRRRQVRQIAGIRETKPGPAELGALVSVHRSSGHRRRRGAGWATVLGFAGFVAVLWFGFTALGDDSRDHMVPIGGYAALAGLAFTALVSGLSVGRHDRRHGDEEFRLHEGGFVHTDRHGTKTVKWADVAYVHLRSGGTNWTAAGKVELRDGTRIVVAGMVDNGFSLLETAQQAVHLGRYPRRTR
ncbi:hypothetical protein VSH64_42450 [Amycolatopsis rhabdoformis]|uniref:Uncharacterized protein n=1 Tax=Amycolatopsis rhabdoformis TaxID=1448059 RepID=A0ABZ1I4U8_9PSEU|nr:hypothetical protein [Amycolatopsis rhabdoformis]WSE29397.1 hypothetical protein VSH64_42450 [Amycolatopsis rhabdoformis]